MKKPAGISGTDISMLFFVLLILVTVGIRLLGDLLETTPPATDMKPGQGAVVEVTDLKGMSTVYLFDRSVDACDVADVSDMNRSSVERCLPLKSGRALFELPGGRVRVGLMSGRDLMVLGLPVPVNLASAQDLDVLPGIGEALSSRIETERLENGPFYCARDLKRVKGIGQKKDCTFKRYLSFESAY